MNQCDNYQFLKTVNVFAVVIHIRVNAKVNSLCKSPVHSVTDLSNLLKLKCEKKFILCSFMQNSAFHTLSSKEY